MKLRMLRALPQILKSRINKPGFIFKKTLTGRIPNYNSLVPGFGVKQVMFLWLFESIIISFGINIFFSLVFYFYDMFTHANSWATLSVSLLGLFNISGISDLTSLDTSIVDKILI